MRIFGARIFSKSFGGKIQNFQTDSNEMEKLKNGACVFKAPVFFLSFLAGKLDKIEQPFP